MMTALAARYEVVTQDISSMLAEKEPCMCGRATLVMLVSSTCITVTIITEKVMAHFRAAPRGASLTSAGGVGAIRGYFSKLRHPPAKECSMMRSLRFAAAVLAVAALAVTSTARAQSDVRSPLPAPVKVRLGMTNVPALSALWLLPEYAAKYNIQMETVLFQRFADPDRLAGQRLPVLHVVPLAHDEAIVAGADAGDADHRLGALPQPERDVLGPERRDVEVAPGQRRAGVGEALEQHGLHLDVVLRRVVRQQPQRRERGDVRHPQPHLDGRRQRAAHVGLRAGGGGHGERGDGEDGGSEAERSHHGTLLGRRMP